MYGQMTAGSWIYIGTQGILQGTYETFAAVAAKRFGGSLAGTHHAHRRARRDGRRPAARGDDERRRGARASTCDPSRISPPHRARLPRRAGRRPRRRDRAAPTAPRGRGRAAVRRAARQRGRGAARARCDAAPRSTSSPTRPRPTTRSTLPARAARRSRTWPRAAGRATPTVHPRAPATSMAAHVEAHGRLPGRGRRGLRLRQLDPRRGGAGRATSAPSPSPASCPPTSGRCSARARARSAGRRCRATRPTSPPPTRPSSTFPGQRAAGPLDPDGRGEGRTSRACPPGSAGSATASGTWPGCASTSWSRAATVRRRSCIGRDHLDCGSVASPYRETEAMADGSDAIADWPLLNALVNTASRRLLGERPPRRRRRHRPLDPRRAGRASPTAPSWPRAEAGAGADQRPGHGRDPARRRRLRARPTAVARPSAASASRWL